MSDHFKRNIYLIIGFNLSPVALHANIIVKHSLAFLTVASQIVDFQFAESQIAESKKNKKNKK
jgi:hypothetical protein